MFARRKKSITYSNSPVPFTSTVNSHQKDRDTSRSKNITIYQTSSVRSRSLPPLNILEPDSIWADSESVSAYDSLRRPNANNIIEEVSTTVLVSEFDSPFYTNYRLQSQLNQNVQTPELFSRPPPEGSLLDRSPTDAHLELPGVFSPHVRKSSFRSHRDSNSHQSNSSQSQSLNRTNASPSVQNLTPPRQMSINSTMYTDSAATRRKKSIDVSKPILLTTSSNIPVMTREQAMFTHGPSQYRQSKQNEGLYGSRSVNQGQDYQSQTGKRVDDDGDALSMRGSIKSFRSKRSNSLSFVDGQSSFNFGKAPPVPQLPIDVNSLWKMAAVEASEQFAVEDNLKHKKSLKKKSEVNSSSLPSHIFDLKDTNSKQSPRVINSQIPISPRMNTSNLRSITSPRPTYTNLSDQIVPEFDYDVDNPKLDISNIETKIRKYSLESTLERPNVNRSQEKLSLYNELQQDSLASLGLDQNIQNSPKLPTVESLSNEHESMLQNLRMKQQFANTQRRDYDPKPFGSPTPPPSVPLPPIPILRTQNPPSIFSVGPASAPVISQSSFSPRSLEYFPPPLPPPQIPPPKPPSQPTSTKFNQQPSSSNYRFSYQSERTTLDRVNYDREIFEFSPSPIMPMSPSYSPYPQTHVPRKESIQDSDFNITNKSGSQEQTSRKSTDNDSRIPRAKFSIISNERQSRQVSPKRSVVQQARNAFLKAVGFGKSTKRRGSVKSVISDPDINIFSPSSSHLDENKPKYNHEE
ncbi:hypothetical protein HK096_004729, partial [Nowakowskiella sp. JEL0078]